MEELMPLPRRAAPFHPHMTPLLQRMWPVWPDLLLYQGSKKSRFPSELSQVLKVYDQTQIFLKVQLLCVPTPCKSNKMDMWAEESGLQAASFWLLLYRSLKHLQSRRILNNLKVRWCELAQISVMQPSDWIFKDFNSQPYEDHVAHWKNS